jgi:hypothetical protein
MILISALVSCEMTSFQRHLNLNTWSLTKVKEKNTYDISQLHSTTLDKRYLFLTHAVCLFYPIYSHHVHIVLLGKVYPSEGEVIELKSLFMLMLADLPTLYTKEANFHHPLEGHMKFDP